jgi:cobalt-precorrin-5B (C1)-methyltransferase
MNQPPFNPTPFSTQASQDESAPHDSSLTAEVQLSIEKSIRIALADSPDELLLSSGNNGQSFAQAKLNLAPSQIVQVPNGMEYAFRRIGSVLEELEYRIGQLWVIGHPGNLARFLDPVSNDHSEEKPSGIQALARLATELNLPEDLVAKMASADSVDQLIEIVGQEPLATGFWQVVESRLGYMITGRVGNVRNVAVRVLNKAGEQLNTI